MPIPTSSLSAPGRIIRKARTRCGLKLDDVAERLDIGRHTAQRLEITPSIPPPKRFRAVCALLEISNVDLLAAYGYLDGETDLGANQDAMSGENVDDDLIGSSEAAKTLGISRGTLIRRESEGTGPPVVRPTPSAHRRYRRGSLRDYMKES